MHVPRFHYRPFPTRTALFCATVCVLALAPCLFSQTQEKSPEPAAPAEPKAPVLSPKLQGLLKDGWNLYIKRQDDASRENVEKALTLAKEEKNIWGEGEAHRILGLLALQEAKYPESKSELEQALALFESVSATWSVAFVHKHLGAVENGLGHYAQAVDYYQKGLSEFEKLHDVIDQALVLEGLMFIDSLPMSERDAYAEKGLTLARQTGNKALAGHFLHSIGDHLFNSGDYATALEKLNEAATAFEEANDRAALARVWTSLGRLYRAHGAFDDAIASYQKGLSIQQELGDKEGVIQSLNAMAISYQYSGRGKEAMEHYERALALARETGSSRVIAFIAGNVGNAYCESEKNYSRGAELLEESLRLNPSASYAGQRYSTLSMCFANMGDTSRAMEAVEKALSLTHDSGSQEILLAALWDRSVIHRKLGQLPDALEDLEEAIHVEEKIRAHLMPADYLKQDYAEGNRDLFAQTVELHEQLGQHKEAMVAAEQARARAFLDLLASRGIGQEDKQPSASAAENDPSVSSPAKNADAAGSKEPGPVALPTRGANPLLLHGATGSPLLSSRVSAAPPTFDELISTAKRLDSSLLSYWVTQDAIFAWLLKPDGTVHSQKITVTPEQLSKLIRATSYGEDEAESPAAVPSDSKPEVQIHKTAATRGAQALRLRGGGELVLGGSKEQAWRELYKLLILPLREALPPPGSHLTIVPQGPLFRLSFAALQDERGHYLIENYALNYAPSLGVLRLTGEQKQQLAQREPSYLIIADPQIAPDLAKDPGLPSLPGARNEARNLLRLLPGGETTLLMGADATKAAIRERAPGKTVLHLATHAIVRDDRPFDSFLVLSAGIKSPPGDARLNVQEIYNLDLHADLVVLSACRTALGKLSGDGIAGLTRAFFYGGTPSVMATMWDVADEPTSFLITDFYKSLKGDADKSQALRIAQIHLIQRLRSGRIKVNTPVGSVVLPEDPVFWAGFVLQGEP